MFSVLFSEEYQVNHLFHKKQRSTQDVKQIKVWKFGKKSGKINLTNEIY